MGIRYTTELYVEGLIMDRIVSTEQFWQLMRHPCFIRETLNKSACQGDEYYCSNPPEKVEGFIPAKMQKSIDSPPDYVSILFIEVEPPEID